jgi:hypothetical protein
LIESCDSKVKLLLNETQIAGQISDFEAQMKDYGQRRNTLYEPKLKTIFDTYNQGFNCYPQLRPDVILEEYTPCSVTQSRAEDAESINRAIRRRAHSLEFTSFLTQNLRGFDTYLLGKVESYAKMLANVLPLLRIKRWHSLNRQRTCLQWLTNSWFR